MSLRLDHAIYNTDGTGVVDAPVTTTERTCVLMGISDGTNVFPLKGNSDGEILVNLETADIEIGAVELKNATTDDRALIGDANTGRNATDHVLLVQAIDAAGGVVGGTAAEFDTIVATLGTIDADTSQLELVTAASDATAPTNVAIIGLYTSEAVPTESTADGRVLAFWGDRFGRQIGYSDDITQGVRQVQDATALTGIPMEVSYTQLTAAGDTAATDVSLWKNHTFHYTIASIDTNVVVGIDSSLDGTNWVRIGTTLTITANGTYEFEIANYKTKYLRFSFDSEAGGANATIDVDSIHGN